MIESTGLLDIDLFSLDVEGSEMVVLQTIDFEVTNVKVVLVELSDHYPEERNARVRSFLEEKGFGRDEYCSGSDRAFCAHSELFINPQFEQRKASRPPPPMKC